MGNFLRAALVAATVTGAALGLAGGATAAPLHDPLGLCATHNAEGECLYGAAGPSRSIDVTFPAGGPQEQQIVDYATKTVNDFTDMAGPLGTLDNPLPLEDLTITGTRYTSGTPQTGTQSVVLEVNQMIRGAAHPMDWYQSFTYNDATQAPVTFGTLFRPGTAPLPVIVPIVERQLSEQAGAPITLDPAIGLDPANYQSFAVTDDAVLFFFGKNEIHAAYGATSVSVPRTAIADLLTPGI